METLIDGPYFEDLQPGQRFDDCPGLTLTEGLAAAHRAIVGGRLPLVLDAELSAGCLARRRARGAQPRLGRRHRSVNDGDPHRGGQPLLPRGGLPGALPGSATPSAPSPRSSACARTPGGPDGPRPDWPRCGSAPPTSWGGRSWTSGAAPCSRCATPTPTPGTPTTCRPSAPTRPRASWRRSRRAGTLTATGQRWGQARGSGDRPQVTSSASPQRMSCRAPRVGAAHPQRGQGAS